jgi:hypothetical protein
MARIASERRFVLHSAASSDQIFTHLLTDASNHGMDDIGDFGHLGAGRTLETGSARASKGTQPTLFFSLKSLSDGAKVWRSRNLIQKELKKGT